MIIRNIFCAPSNSTPCPDPSPCSNGGWVRVRAVHYPQNCQNSTAKTKAASIQTTKLDIKAEIQNSSVETRVTWEAHAMEFHRSYAGAEPADPAPWLITRKRATPCSSHVSVAHVRVYINTGGTLLIRNPHRYLHSLRQVLAWPCLS